MYRFALPLVAAVAALSCAGCEADPASENLPPTLNLDVASTIDYVIGEGTGVRITLTGADPEGGPVTLGAVDAPERADFTVFDEWAVFDWSPIASDVTPMSDPKQLIFYAEDQLGGRTERVVSVSIRVGNGQPSFLNSPSVLHNVDSDKPVRFNVRIRDDDSDRVAIVMPASSAPDGAEFTVTGDKEGLFEWEPSESQLEHRSHWVTFTANDGQNETVEQRVSILLNKGGDTPQRPNPGGGGEENNDPTACYYEDRIKHTPLEAQYGAMDYRVEARLAGDAVDKFDRLVLNWSMEDLYNEWGDIQPEGAEMQMEDGVFVGTIPNPLFSAGESREIYYEICAIDDDSQDDDAVLCGPTSIYHSFIAYSPDDEGTCIDDAFANHNFDNAWTLEDLWGWEHHRGCGESAPDYYRLDLQAQQDGEVIFTYPFDKGVDVEMYDVDKNLIAIQPSQCSGFATVFIENMTDQPMTRFFRVVADNLPYQVSPALFEPRSSCIDTDIEPNDTKADATPIGVFGDPEPMQELCGGNDVDIFSFFAFAGERVTTTLEFTDADGDIDAKLYAPDKEANVDTDGFASAYALSSDDNETLEYTVKETGTHYISVFGYGQGNTYTITNLAEMPPACQDDDTYAGNGTEAMAANLSINQHSGLILCGGTSDWYTFDASADDLIGITLRVTDGNIDDVMLEALLNGVPFGGAMRNGDKITLDVYAQDASTFTLHVQSSSDITYDLTLGYVI